MMIRRVTYPASSRAYIKSKQLASYNHSSSKFSTMNSRLGRVQVGWMGLMSFPMTCAPGNSLKFHRQYSKYLKGHDDHSLCNVKCPYPRSSPQIKNLPRILNRRSAKSAFHKQKPSRWKTVGEEKERRDFWGLLTYGVPITRPGYLKFASTFSIALAKSVMSFSSSSFGIVQRLVNPCLNS